MLSHKFRRQIDGCGGRSPKNRHYSPCTHDQTSFCIQYEPSLYADIYVYQVYLSGAHAFERKHVVKSVSNSYASLFLSLLYVCCREIYQNQTDFSERGSLLWILDRTKTRFGARLLKTWIGRPLIDRAILQERVDAVEEIVAGQSHTLDRLHTLLRKLPDLVKGLCRIQYGKVKLTTLSNCSGWY